MKLKILSLWQPHATLCVTPSLINIEKPAKPVETRHWPTKHRGWLGIHSAMKKDPLYMSLCKQPVFKQYIPDFEKLPFGYILGMVNIEKCLSTDDSALCFNVADGNRERTDEIFSFGDFSYGRYGFIISDFIQFTTPVKASGSQGFWFHKMPNHIGEKVKTWNDLGGIVLDYNADQHPYEYLVRLDNNRRQWFAKDDFEIINSVQAKTLF